MKIQQIFLSAAFVSTLMLSACNSNQQGKEAQKSGHGAIIKPEVKVPTFDSVSAETRGQVEKILTAYLGIKNGLVDSDVDKAKQGAQQLSQALQGFDASKMPADQQAFYKMRADMLREDAEQIASGSELEHQRDYMGMLSEHTYELVKAFEAYPSTLYHQYCPMALDNKGAFWLSEVEEIENPYFGDKMLHCGSTEETLRAN